MSGKLNVTNVPKKILDHYPPLSEFLEDSQWYRPTLVSAVRWRIIESLMYSKGSKCYMAFEFKDHFYETDPFEKYHAIFQFDCRLLVGLPSSAALSNSQTPKIPPKAIPSRHGD